MRVLLLNYEFPPLGGGAATASAQIAREMAARGAEVAVLTSLAGDLPRREKRNGYTVYRVPVMRRNADRCSLPEMGAFIACSAIPALKLARQFRPDILHVFFGMPTGPVGWLISRALRVPYLLSLRGDDVPGRQGGALALAHRVMSPLTRAVWSRAGALVVNGEGLRERATRVVPGRHIELVPNGVDLGAFSPRQEREIAEGRKLLFVGRLHEQKGLSHLLEAVAMLAPELRQRVSVEFVGSGPDEERLRGLVRGLGLAQQVSFAGWVAREDMAPRYREADLFAFPSYEEGMPNVVLEAMACGLPVVASDIPGVRGLVRDGENGLLVPPADAGAFSNALAGLLSDDAMLRRTGRESYRLAQGYSWASTATCYMEISEAVMAAQREKTRRVRVAAKRNERRNYLEV